MIIGNGDIASVLPKRDDLLFFASGVSNSKEDRESEYQREVDLLLAQDKEEHLVYFSSLAIFYSDTRYAQHKFVMEQLVKDNFQRYTIIRLGNITWGKNPHTLINHLKNQLKNNELITIDSVYRFIVDEEEFLYWLNLIPAWSTEMNIPGRRMLVQDVYEEFVTK